MTVSVYCIPFSFLDVFGVLRPSSTPNSVLLNTTCILKENKLNFKLAISSIIPCMYALDRSGYVFLNALVYSHTTRPATQKKSPLLHFSHTEEFQKTYKLQIKSKENTMIKSSSHQWSQYNFQENPHLYLIFRTCSNTSIAEPSVLRGLWKRTSYMLGLLSKNNEVMVMYQELVRSSN